MCLWFRGFQELFAAASGVVKRSDEFSFWCIDVRLFLTNAIKNLIKAVTSYGSRPVV